MIATVSKIKRALPGFWLALFLISAIAVTTAAAGEAQSWPGKVVGVKDGDTIVALHDGRGETIRLYGIDAPEKGQDFGNRAKQMLSDLVFGKVVEIKPMDTDRYGRTVAMVSLSGRYCSY